MATRRHLIKGRGPGENPRFFYKNRAGGTSSRPGARELRRKTVLTRQIPEKKVTISGAMSQIKRVFHLFLGSGTNFGAL